MDILNMHELLAHLSHLSGYLPAALITIGVAMLIACGLSCNCAPCKEQDDLFRREVY